MRAHLKLLSRFLVDVRAAKHRIPLDARGHWNGATNPSIGPLGVIDDFLRRRIKRPMIVRFHPNSNPTFHRNRPLPRSPPSDVAHSTFRPTTGGETLAKIK